MTATARRLIDIGEVSRMLAARMQSLAPELLPNGKRASTEWTVGSPAGEPGTQMAIHLTGAKAGVWKHFAGSESGDALDLVAVVLFAGDKGRALAWSLRYLGLESGDPAALETARRATPPAHEIDAKTAEEIQTTRNNARRIWLAAHVQCRDTPVDTYLQGRGIRLAELGRQPGAIRFHDRLWHPPSGRHWPGMVAAVSGDAPGGFLACHRTWLEVQTDGRVTKAPIDRNKAVLGSYKGGHIALNRGATGKPLRDTTVGEVLDITEGIEDGLSVAYAAPECRVVAAISISNWASMELPPAVLTVRLWRQNDTKPAAIAAFDRVLRAQMTAGRRVLIADVPRGMKDVNDLLCGDDE